MKMAIGLLLVLGLSGIVRAEYADNPDRVPSIGLNLMGSSQTGSMDVSGGAIFTSQNARLRTGEFVVDARVPISNGMTFTTSLGLISSRAEGLKTQFLYGQKTALSGASASIGVRFYLK